MFYDLVRSCFWPTGLTGASHRSDRWGPDSPAICPDTPGSWGFRYSGYGSGFSGLGGPDTPSICPGTPYFGLRMHLGRTGLTGWVYRSDRYSWAEQE